MKQSVILKSFLLKYPNTTNANLKQLQGKKKSVFHGYTPTKGKINPEFRSSTDENYFH